MTYPSDVDYAVLQKSSSQPCCRTPSRTALTSELSEILDGAYDRLHIRRSVGEDQRQSSASANKVSTHCTTYICANLLLIASVPVNTLAH